MFGLSKILCAKKPAPKPFNPTKPTTVQPKKSKLVKRKTPKVDVALLKEKLKNQSQKLQDVVKKLDTLKQERLKEFKKKPDNLYDILFRYANKGVGLKVTRSIWRRPECYWTITDVKFTKQLPEIKRGKSTGILTWRGVSEEKPRLIPGHFKRGSSVNAKVANLLEWHVYDPEFSKKFEDKSKWIQNQYKPRGSHTWKQLEDLEKKSYRFPPV